MSQQLTDQEIKDAFKANTETAKYYSIIFRGNGSFRWVAETPNSELIAYAEEIIFYESFWK